MFNIPTIIICVLLIAAVVAITVYLVRKKKNGCDICDGDCSSCKKK